TGKRSVGNPRPFHTDEPAMEMLIIVFTIFRFRHEKYDVLGADKKWVLISAEDRNHVLEAQKPCQADVGNDAPGEHVTVHDRLLSGWYLATLPAYFGPHFHGDKYFNIFQCEGGFDRILATSHYLQH